MKRPSIVEVAAVAGIAAFLWTIVSSKPPRGPANSQPDSFGPPHGFAPRAETPTDIPGLVLRVRNDPGDLWALYWLARRYEMYNQPVQAREAYTQLIARTATLDPQGRPYAYGRNIFLRAWAHRALGQTEEATREFADCAAWYTRRAEDPNNDFRTNRALLMRLGWARRLSGDERGARAAWSDALDTTWRLSDSPDPALDYDKAALLCLLDRPEDGLTALTLAAERGYDDPEGAQADEAFAAIRDDERFHRTIDWIRRTDLTRRWNELMGLRPGGHRIYRNASGTRQL